MGYRDENKEAYILKVRDDTRRYIMDLLGERDRFESSLAAAESENLLLHNQIDHLRQELSGFEKKHDHLQRKLGEMESAKRRFYEQYLEVEQQNNSLASLYVASYRLHGTLDKSEVLAIIQEVVINLIGSEEFAIFDLNAARSTLELSASFGIEPGNYRRIPLGSGQIGNAALTGEMCITTGRDGDEPLPGEMNLTACVPLKLDGKVTGTIAIFSLLEQKGGLQPIDYDLLSLLATHAAAALYCAGVYSRLGAQAGVY